MRDAVLNPAAPAALIVPEVNRAAIEQADLAAILILSPKAGMVTVAVAIQLRDERIMYS